MIKLDKVVKLVEEIKELKERMADKTRELASLVSGIAPSKRKKYKWSAYARKKAKIRMKKRWDDKKKKAAQEQSSK